MKTNTFFEELERVGAEWTKKHEAHKALKQQIIDTNGWDSEELKAWYAKEEQMRFPYSQGVCKAYRAWKYSSGEEVEMSDFVWETETEDFIGTLRKAGIDTFVITNKSTALMENLRWFEESGCRLVGLCTITRTENRFGEEETESIMGIRFSIN